MKLRASFARNLGRTNSGFWSEEVVLLLYVLGRDPVLRALAVDELGFRVEGLAAAAVETCVDAIVDLPRVVNPLQELLHQPLVALVGRADEEVVGDVDPLGHLEELGRVAVDELLRLQAGLLRHARDVRPVLVRAGQEERLLSALAVVAREDVRGDRRVGMAHVRRRVDVVNRCRDVEAHSRQSYE
jgi:hypothetical protein